MKIYFLVVAAAAVCMVDAAPCVNKDGMKRHKHISNDMISFSDGNLDESSKEDLRPDSGSSLVTTVDTLSIILTFNKPTEIGTIKLLDHNKVEKIEVKVVLTPGGPSVDASSVTDLYNPDRPDKRIWFKIGTSVVRLRLILTKYTQGQNMTIRLSIEGCFEEIISTTSTPPTTTTSKSTTAAGPGGSTTGTGTTTTDKPDDKAAGPGGSTTGTGTTTTDKPDDKAAGVTGTGTGATTSHKDGAATLGLPLTVMLFSLLVHFFLKE